MSFSNASGSFDEPYDDVRKTIEERGVEISFNYVDFLGGTCDFFMNTEYN